jgi:hypothetical protein
MKRLALVLLFVACKPSDPKEALRAELKRHVIQKASFWGHYTDQPFTARLRDASPELLDYLAKDNRLWDFTEVPRAARPDAAFARDLELAMQSIPERVAALTRARLVAVVVVEELGSSAYQEVVRGADEKVVGGFIVLDRAALDRTANAWATWRENDPFAADPRVTIRATLEEPAGDTRANAMRFIILHELGHIIADGASPPLHPPAFEFPPKERQADYVFYRESWRSEADKNLSLFDAEFPERAGVKFYHGASTKTPAARAPRIYEALARTNLPSLYGATAPYDDFAEAFATYVHTVLDKRPYRIEVSVDGAPATRFDGLWGTPRAEAKAAVLAKLLGP